MRKKAKRTLTSAGIGVLMLTAALTAKADNVKKQLVDFFGKDSKASEYVKERDEKTDKLWYATKEELQEFLSADTISFTEAQKKLADENKKPTNSTTPEETETNDDPPGVKVVGNKVVITGTLKTHGTTLTQADIDKLQPENQQLFHEIGIKILNTDASDNKKIAALHRLAAKLNHNRITPMRPTAGGNHPAYSELVSEDDKARVQDIRDQINEDQQKKRITSLSHTQLLAQNTTYANNYKYVQDHFGPAVSKTCDDIAGERAMTPDEQKAYKLSVYEDYTTRPQAYTTQLKKATLGLYYNDVSWNTATKGKIDQAFADLMRKTKLFIATGNPAGVPIPKSIKTQNQIDRFKNADDGF